MIFHLIINLLAGFGAHFSYQLTGRLGNGWSQLSAYTLGVLFNLPFVVVVHDDLAGLEPASKRLVAAYLVSYLAFGVGTVLGWVAYPMQGPPIFDRHELDR